MPKLMFFAHANVFHYNGKCIPIEIALARIPEEGAEPEVCVIPVDHTPFHMTEKDWRTNLWIQDQIHLPFHLPDGVPYHCVDFVVRGKYSVMHQGQGGLVGVKGLDQGRLFHAMGLPVFCVGMLPKFHELPEDAVPTGLHRQAHEYGNTSQCAVVKAYRFAKYLAPRKDFYDYSDEEEEEDGFSY